jgi:uncharacterized membrane protein
VPITKRITSVDIVRGAVMVLMALDHVRDYVTNLRIRPEDLSRGSAALFATRWLTHFCAPTFFLLAGVGIGLANRNPRPGLSAFLIKRGVWLIFLDLVVTAIGWQFGFQLIPAFAIVIWTLAWSMIVMAAVIHAPRTATTVVALLMITLHNLFDSVQPNSLGAFGPLWTFLHVPGFVIPGKLFTAYPLIPWVGVMALGYVLAGVYEWDDERRRSFLLRVGLAATVAFIAVRAINHYGDTFPWSHQRTTALTIASFFNVRKYPPSLDFLLMTLGPALVMLAIAERWRGRVAGWLTVYGRVPLFYYVVHIYVIHAIAVCLAWIQGGHPQRILAVTAPETIPAWYGVSLPGVYVAWSLVGLLMYWPCWWFSRLKATRNDWWLRYT